MTQASDEPFCAIPSPDGAAELLIEQGDRSAHAYLVPLSMRDSTMRHCWIRNLTAAPDAWDVETMEAGNAPSLPREFCRDAGAAEPLDADRLRALWLPAGDGVALYEGEDLLIYIPPWSGHDGFPGYARDCASPSQIAWPMPEDPAPITEQLSHAEEFWEAWVAEPNLWDRLQPKFIEAAESALGTDSRYFAIDNGKWPPKAVLFFQQPDCMVAVTVGVSLRPQPRIVMEAENATAVHRIELALALPLTSAEEVIVRCGKSLSGLASLPWENFTFLAHGHSVSADCFPALDDGSVPTAAVLTAEQDSMPQIEFPDVMGDAVNVLWLIPITDQERQLAIREGSDELLHFLQHDPTPRFVAEPPAAGQRWFRRLTRFFSD